MHLRSYCSRPEQLHLMLYSSNIAGNAASFMLTEDRAETGSRISPPRKIHIRWGKTAKRDTQQHSARVRSNYQRTRKKIKFTIGALLERKKSKFTVGALLRGRVQTIFVKNNVKMTFRGWGVKTRDVSRLLRALGRQVTFFWGGVGRNIMST